MSDNPKHSRDVDYRNRRGGPGKFPATVLGLVSAGLGVCALARTEELAGVIGLPEDDLMLLAVRVIGARELLSASGLLVRRHPQRWLWSRVAGDAMDLALVAAAMRMPRASRSRLALSGAVLAGVALTDTVAALRVRGASGPTGGDEVVRARVAITVNKPIDDVYSFWRDFENLPSFMEHLESVQTLDGARTHWRAKAPLGRAAEWDATIIADRRNELIAWQSERGARIPNRGSVRFAEAPANQGTAVTVDLQYEPPGGAAGSMIARLLGEEPVQQVKDDLRRFKQVMETGEITRSESSPEGTKARRQLLQRDAQAGSQNGRR